MQGQLPWKTPNVGGASYLERTPPSVSFYLSEEEPRDDRMSFSVLPQKERDSGNKRGINIHQK